VERARGMRAKLKAFSTSYDPHAPNFNGVPLYVYLVYTFLLYFFKIQLNR